MYPFFKGSQGLLLEPIPAVSGRRQGAPWTTRQFITGPSGARWGSASCSRTLPHAAQLSPGEQGFGPETFWSLADLFYPLIYKLHDHEMDKFNISCVQDVKMCHPIMAIGGLFQDKSLHFAFNTYFYRYSEMNSKKRHKSLQFVKMYCKLLYIQLLR